jgi:hypothetical protein
VIENSVHLFICQRGGRREKEGIDLRQSEMDIQLYCARWGQGFLLFSSHRWWLAVFHWYRICRLVSSLEFGSTLAVFPPPPKGGMCAHLEAHWKEEMERHQMQKPKWRHTSFNPVNNYSDLQKWIIREQIFILQKGAPWDFFTFQVLLMHKTYD